MNYNTTMCCAKKFKKCVDLSQLKPVLVFKCQTFSNSLVIYCIEIKPTAIVYVIIVMYIGT